MKKFLALLLVMMLIMTSFTACGSKGDADVETPDTNLEQDAENGDEEVNADADADAEADTEEEGEADAGTEGEAEADQEDEPVKEEEKAEQKPADKKEESKPADKKEEPKSADTSGKTDKNTSDKKEEKPADQPATGTSVSGTPAEIIDKIYAQFPVADLPLGTMEVDITDPDALKMITGLSSADKISAAAFSESMMGAQAYSLVVVKVKDSSDAKAVAEEMASGIDKRKWVCVEADDLSVGAAGDVVVLMMVDSSFAETVTSANIIDAFSAVAGGLDVRL